MLFDTSQNEKGNKKGPANKTVTSIPFGKKLIIRYMKTHTKKKITGHVVFISLLLLTIKNADNRMQ
jgi:hypothetical protein